MQSNESKPRGTLPYRIVHKFSFNAPVVLTFVLLCAAARIAADLTGERSNSLLFCVYRSSFADPLAYVRVFLHVLGHGSWSHLLNNMLYILILGPMLEEKYGHADLLLVILATALVTGIINLCFFPNTALLGASGVVFAMILLSSITETKEHTIPVTFLLVALLYLGKQVYDGLFVDNNVSEMAHIVGGLLGSGFGFLMNGIRRKKA